MDYTDQIEPFVGPTQAPPADPPAASPYGERYDKLVKFLEGVDVKPSFVPDAKTFMDAPLKAKIGTLLSAGMMMVPAGRMGSTPRAAPRAPAPELHELLGESSPRPAASGGEAPQPAADNVVPLRPQPEPTAETANANARVAGEPASDPGTYAPYEIPKASRGYPDTANSNTPGGRFVWQDNQKALSQASGLKQGPDFWHISSDNQTVGSIATNHADAAGRPSYTARAWDNSPYPNGQRYVNADFRTLDAAKQWAEGHMRGESLAAEPLQARENFATVEGGRREARRPGLPPTTTPELLDRLGYTEKQLTRAEETLAKAEQAVKDAPASDYGDNPKFWEAVRIRDAAKRSHERAQESHQGVLDEMMDRPKQGDAKDVSMFEPPTRAPRPFEADYPNGAPHEGTGIITRDIEGRPLTAPFVAGRNTVGGADRPISPAHYDVITKGLLGEAAQEIPQGSRPGNVGNTLFDTQSRLPFRVEIVKGINKTQRPRVYGHEVGHVLDQFAMEIPTAGIERELYKLYNSLNNPIRTKGGNDAHPWSRRMTPQRMGYEEDARPRELIAEAMRAYMANPNYIKAEAPNVAKRLRSYVNAHPWIKKTIQLNSLGALGIIATEHDEL